MASPVIGTSQNHTEVKTKGKEHSMVDFSKWVDAWNTYIPTGSPVGNTPAAICLIVGGVLSFIGIAGVILTLFSFFICGHDKTKAKTISVVSLVLLGLVVGGGCLTTASKTMPSHVTTSSKEPPVFTEQVEKTWGLDDLSDCKKDKGIALPFTGLPEYQVPSGTWNCVAYKDGHKSSVTLVGKGNKVGLYVTTGKALEPVGKEK